ncbi:MAG: protease inhibitor I42 family protein [Candidatus Methanoperedens sp.]|nr:protease inhibitor I42 family protein [Candidatus Methanoperedens sp.]
MADFKLILIVLIISSLALGCTQPQINTQTPTDTPIATETAGITATPAFTPVPSLIPAPSPGVNVTELKVSLNQVFTLSFEANPSTGYSWIAIVDESFLKLKNDTFAPYPHPPQVVGRGGKENFTFIPLKTGETDLVIQYKRVWEKDVLVEKTFQIIITG